MYRGCLGCLQMVLCSFRHGHVIRLKRLSQLIGQFGHMTAIALQHVLWVRVDPILIQHLLRVRIDPIALQLWPTMKESCSVKDLISNLLQDMN